MVHPVGDHIRLAHEARNPERVNDVLRLQPDGDLPPHRNAEFVRRHQVAAVRTEAGIAELEPPLMADGRHLEDVLVRRLRGSGDPDDRGHGDGDEDEDRNDRPRDLERVVAVYLLRGASGALAVPDEDVRHRREHEEPDDARGDDDEDVDGVNALRRVRPRLERRLRRVARPKEREKRGGAERQPRKAEKGRSASGPGRGALNEGRGAVGLGRGVLGGSRGEVFARVRCHGGLGAREGATAMNITQARLGSIACTRSARRRRRGVSRHPPSAAPQDPSSDSAGQAIWRRFG